MASSNLRSKVRLFRKTLESARTPNESGSEREANAIKSIFAEWYDLARSYGIVIGCREENEIVMV